MASKALLKEERFQLSPKNVFTESGKEESRNVYDTTHSVQFSRSVVSNSLRPHEPQHIRPPCPSPTPGVHPNPCPLSQWCHPTISSSVVAFSFCPHSSPASGSFQMSQLFTSGGQSIGVSASISVLPMNTQDWSPLGWTGWISYPLDSIILFSFLIRIIFFHPEIKICYKTTLSKN